MGDGKYITWTPSPINGFQIGPKEKKIEGLKQPASRCVLCSLFLGDFSKFRQNAISKRLNACFGTKNEVGKGNGLFFHIFTKKGKKGKKGTIYVDFSENLKFRIFE